MGCDVTVNVIHQPELACSQTNIPEALTYPHRHYLDVSEYVITDHFTNMVDTHWKYIMCCNCEKNLLDENWLDAYNQQYHPLLLNERLIAARIVPTAIWDWPDTSWFNFRWCTGLPLEEFVTWWYTWRRCTWCTTTWRYSRQRNYRLPITWSNMYPWSNEDNCSSEGSRSGQCGGESLWHSNWII